LSQGDPYDLAIWDLPEATVQHLQSEHTFLTAAAVDYMADFIDDLYFVCGFPCALATPAIEDGSTASLTPMHLVTSLYVAQPDEKPLPGHDRKYHVVLNYNRANTVPETRNAKTLPKKLHGVSGGAIWRGYFRPTNSLKPGQAKLVAVQTCVYPVTNAIRGTTLDAIARLIQITWPDVRPCFKLLLR
jgi:hypothetical protein